MSYPTLASATTAAPPGSLSRHGLRTPLLAITGAAELLVAGEAGPIAAPARILLREITEAAGRLARVGEALCRLAELANADPAPPQAIALDRLLRAAGLNGALGHGHDARILADPEPALELLRLAMAVLEPCEAAIDPLPRKNSGEISVRLASSRPAPAQGSGDHEIERRLLARLAALARARLGENGDRLELIWQAAEP